MRNFANGGFCLTEVKMNETTIAIQENVLEGPSLFSNNPRTMKNLAMIALTTAGTVNKTVQRQLPHEPVTAVTYNST